MRFAPSLSSRERQVLEHALPQVLRGGERPVLAATCSTLRRFQTWLLITDQRIIGLDSQGAVVREVSGHDVLGYEVTAMGTLVLSLQSRSVKFGLLGGKGKAVREALAETYPQLRSTDGEATAASQGAVMDGPAGATTAPATAAAGLAGQLSQLAELRRQGALSEQEYQVAKQATLQAASGHAVPQAQPAHRPQPTPARRGRKVREMERTCSRDGTVWFVPLEVARSKKENGLLRFGLAAQEASETSFMVPGGTTASTQLGRIDAKWARALAARQCPQCGSQAFTERVVKH